MEVNEIPRKNYSLVNEIKEYLFTPQDTSGVTFSAENIFEFYWLIVEVKNLAYDGIEVYLDSDSIGDPQASIITRNHSRQIILVTK